MQLLSFIFRDGKFMPFWTTRWLGQYTLAMQYPNLYMVVLTKDASVWNQGSCINGCQEWSIGWCIDIVSYDICAKEKNLMALLHEVISILNKQDIVVWPYGVDILSL